MTTTYTTQSDVAQQGADPVRRCEPAADLDRPAERRQEPVAEVSADDRGLEESGYGYGV